MVYFVGAGPGAKDLITVRGMRLLEQADVIIYAGSLVNPELLSYAGSGAKIYDLQQRGFPMRAVPASAHALARRRI